MQIIIPMTGYGSRFVAAGYKDLKPFIQVQGKPIIQWIVEGMYPNEKNILFVCRKEHLDSIAGLEKRLKKIAPTARIFAIDDWVKKGPVFDVLRAFRDAEGHAGKLQQLFGGGILPGVGQPRLRSSPRRKRQTQQPSGCQYQDKSLPTVIHVFILFSR